MHWCLISPAVGAWCPCLSFYLLCFCPGQHLSTKTGMWWVVLVQRGVMELLRHSRSRVKAACHTRYTPPPLTDGIFATTSLCLHIWRRVSCCLKPEKGYRMPLSLSSSAIWQEIKLPGVTVIISYRSVVRHADRAECFMASSSSRFSLINDVGW